MKPSLPQVTLVCVDCTDKLHLADRAISKSLECADFGAVKFLTHDETRKHAVKIPRIKSLQEYSRFMIRDLHRHVDTKFAMVVQWDGYSIQPQFWTDGFLDYDFGGAPFQPTNLVGNGGFGIRSKRLLEACSKLPEGHDHPEDACISMCFRASLEAQGLKFMPTDLARQLSFEGRSWDSKEWKGIPNVCTNSFGFHSFLSVLPKSVEKPNILVHSGDSGDIIYSIPVVRAIGGGVLYLTPENKYPYPLDTKWTRNGGGPEFMDNIRPLLEAQDCIWKVQYTHGTPASATHDLNKFRLPWKNRTAKDFHSIKKLHCDAFGVSWPDDKPWLEIKDPIVIPGRPIIVSRSPRYHGSFDWYNLVQKYGDKMVFVGTESEATVFQGFGAPKFSIPHYQTKDALELARVIAGGRVCVMNQSLPLAIAHGLCNPVIVEEWHLNRNCHLVRPNAIYPKDGQSVEIPESWLK